MGEDFAPSADQTETLKPVSHSRILWLMAGVGLVGGIVGSALGSFRFGLGVLIGTALAFANYFWLKGSLRKIFSAAESGERPRMLAGKYFLRYVVLALVVAIFYATDLVPVVAVILGLGAFGFAVVIEGLLRIFSRT
jgi:hypothetical protein